MLLDNHNSHVNLEVITKAKNNHIILLSFPPHCSHNLQPLDVGVYGPLKNYFCRQQTNWMINHPGKTMTIYDLPGIVKVAFPLAFTQKNIINSFKKAGIWPCNEDVFQDSDFAPSFVTDRPDPNTVAMKDEGSRQLKHTSINAEDISLNLESSIQNEIISNMPDIDINISEVIDQISRVPSNIADHSNVPGPSNRMHTEKFNIETVKPFPKASPRIKYKRRRLRKSSILTDTPEKRALEEETRLKSTKKRKISHMKTKNKAKDKGKESFEKNPK